VRFLVLWLLLWHLSKILKRFDLDQHSLRRVSSALGDLAMAGILGIFVAGFDFSVQVIHYLELVVRLLAGMSVVLLAYYCVDIFAQLVRRRVVKGKLDAQIVPLLGKALKVVVGVLGGIFVLQNLDVNVTSLLAGLTIGGLAFSFAAKDTIANLFGSITIFADKSFATGDWIKLGDMEGSVEAIGFRSTRIRTDHESLIIVPNSKFSDTIVENYIERKNQRTTAKLSLPYDTAPQKIEAFCNGIRAILSANQAVRQGKNAYEVSLGDFGESSLKIMLYFFIPAPTLSAEMRVRHEIYVDILRLAAKLGISFAYPAQSLYIESFAENIEKPPTVEPSDDDLKRTVINFGPGGADVVPPGPRLGKPYTAGSD